MATMNSFLLILVSALISCPTWGRDATAPRLNGYAAVESVRNLGKHLLHIFSDIITRIIADPGNCVSDCVESEYMSLRIDPDNRQDCKIERDFIRCLEACPYSQLRDVLLTSRTVGKMICMDYYEDYIKQKNCIQLAGASDSPNATFSECPESGNERILDFVADPFTISGLRYESDSESVIENLTRICNNYHCNVQFNQNIVRLACGKPASELWTKFLRARVKSAVDVYRAFRVLNGTVPECDAFLTA